MRSYWSRKIGVSRLAWGRRRALLFLSIVPLSCVVAFFPSRTPVRATTSNWLPQHPRSFPKDTDILRTNLIERRATHNHNYESDTAPTPPTSTLFPKSKIISSVVEQCRRFLFLLRRQWLAFRKALRFLFQKYTVYVLACENDTFYVGCTTHKRQRWRQHVSAQGGSSWTRRNRPLRIVQQHKRVSEREYLGLEAQVTAHLMWKYGVNRVRGAMFLRSKPYTVQDIDALVGFLGHFNDLQYSTVREELMQSLPGTHEGTTDGFNQHHHHHQHRHHQRAKMHSSKTVRKLAAKSTDVCYACGKRGHWARDCPAVRCYACGKSGHVAADCRHKE